MAQVVEHLPSQWEALVQIPIQSKQNKTNKRKLIIPVSFDLFNVAIRKFKILYGVHIDFCWTALFLATEISWSCHDLRQERLCIT
jgi:hypothetical protein